MYPCKRLPIVMACLLVITVTLQEWVFAHRKTTKIWRERQDPAGSMRYTFICLNAPRLFGNKDCKVEYFSPEGSRLQQWQTVYIEIGELKKAHELSFCRPLFAHVPRTNYRRYNLFFSTKILLGDLPAQNST